MYKDKLYMHKNINDESQILIREFSEQFLHVNSGTQRDVRGYWEIFRYSKRWLFSKFYMRLYEHAEVSFERI